MICIHFILQALSITNINCIDKFRDFLLSYSKCVKCGISFDELMQSNNAKLMCNSSESHTFALNRNSILPILQQFIVNVNNMNSVDEAKIYSFDAKHNNKCIDHFSNLLSLSDIGDFWQTYEQFLPAQNEIIWNTISKGLNEYLIILKKRNQLRNDCLSIKRQNEELKLLLQHKLNA